MSKKRIVVLSVILSVVTLFVILFGVVFCLRKIEINALNTNNYPLSINILDENNDKIKEEQKITNDMIIKASGLKKGTPIFTINKEKIKNNIETKYPSLKVVQIKTLSAIKLQITVRQRVGVYYLKIDSRFDGNTAFYILDEDLVILDQLGLSYGDEISQKYTELVLTDENISTVKSYYDKLSNQNIQTISNSIFNSLCSAVKYKEVVEEGDTKYLVSYDKDSIFVERETLSKVISKITLTKANVDDRFDNVATNLYWITLQLSEGKYIQIYRPDKDLLTKINLSFSSLNKLTENFDTLVCDYQDGNIRLYQRSSKN